jgi:hypothetical protein
MYVCVCGWVCSTQDSVCGCVVGVYVWVCVCLLMIESVRVD